MNEKLFDHFVKQGCTYSELQKARKKEITEWIKQHPDPTPDDFLAPMVCDKHEKVITAFVRCGYYTLKKAFPVEKWANLESIPTLTKIFAGVPRGDDDLMVTMKKLDDKLRTTYNLKHSQQEREQNQTKTPTSQPLRSGNTR